MLRRFFALAALAAVAWMMNASTAKAEERVQLREKCDPGDQWSTELQLEVAGEIYFRSPGKLVTRKLTGTATHQFAERVLAADKAGAPTRMARYYHQAAATFNINDDPSKRSLRDKIRLIVAQRGDDGTLTYSPAGPLTREELELAGDHFDTLMIQGLLPTHAVVVGDAWEIDIPTLQALSGLDGVIKGELKATLKSVKPEAAEITFTGSVHGIGDGAEVRVSKIEGTLTFDRTADRIVAVTWNQEEKRNLGPVSPENKTSCAIKLKRSFAGKAKELGDAVVNNFPEKPDPALLLLLHKDISGRYEFFHERAWYAVVNSDETAVLRLLDRGELIAQLNVTPLEKAVPGKHISPAELARMAKDAAGFTQGDILQSDELPKREGVWVYRHTVLGKAADIDLQQNHYAVAGVSGDQAVFVFTTEVEQAKNLGSRDLAIISSVTLPAKK